MNYYVGLAFGSSILIGATIGAVRARKMDTAYYPFLALIWIATLNEIASFILALTIRDSSASFNTYVLFEGPLVAWQFQRWRLFDRHPARFYLLVLFFVVLWVGERTLLSDTERFASICIIVHAFAIVMMSIDMINVLVVKERHKLIRDATFLICMGFIIYYGFTVLTEIFYFYGLNKSPEIRRTMTAIMHCINLFVNLIFAIAICRIPNRPIFLLPS
jgi:hypothetical protein